jgi:hypothetical protein
MTESPVPCLFLDGGDLLAGEQVFRKQLHARRLRGFGTDGLQIGPAFARQPGHRCGSYEKLCESHGSGFIARRNSIRQASFLPATPTQPRPRHTHRIRNSGEIKLPASKPRRPFPHGWARPLFVLPFNKQNVACTAGRVLIQSQA